MGTRAEYQLSQIRFLRLMVNERFDRGGEEKVKIGRFLRNCLNDMEWAVEGGFTVLVPESLDYFLKNRDYLEEAVVVTRRESRHRLFVR